MLRHSLKQIVAGDTVAKLMHVSKGVLYYRIDVEDSAYQLAVDSMNDEWGDTYILPEYRAITLMRWIRKAIDTETLIQLK